MESSFHVDVRTDGRTTVIAISGELDLATAPSLEQGLQDAENSGATLVILDLRRLAFIDSTGLAILVRAHRRAEESGRRFAVAKGSSQVQRLLELAGLEQRLELIDSPEQLLET